MNKNQIFYNENGWGYTAKEVNQKTYHIEYKTKDGFQSYEDAEAMYEIDQDSFLKSMDAIKKATGMKYTLSSYLTYWYKENLQAYAYGSYQATCAWVIFDMVLPSLEDDVLLKYITAAHIQKILDRVEPICKSAKYMSHKVLSVAMKDAVAERLLSVNPMENVKIPKANVPKVIVYTEEQLKKLLAAVKEYNYGSIYLEVMLAMFLGLRTGEILGIRYDDFDLKEKTVDIKRQYTRDVRVTIKEDNTHEFQGCGCSFKPPKSLCSYRCLRVPDFILDGVQRRNDQNHLYANTKEEFSSEFLDYLCLGPKGTIKSYSTCKNALDVICSRIGIPKAGLHARRHVFATIMLEQGVSLEKLSKMMGHKSVGTTLDIYCGIIQGKEDIRAYVDGKMDPIASSFCARRDRREVL
ncbi:MAG: site-specific integrase [Lachnospiraceae bacterium]|nr:site-specific integrase [Lachnospiraceae bacterium]